MSEAVRQAAAAAGVRPGSATHDFMTSLVEAMEETRADMRLACADMRVITTELERRAVEPPISQRVAERVIREAYRAAATAERWSPALRGLVAGLVLGGLIVGPLCFWAGTLFVPWCMGRG